MNDASIRIFGYPREEIVVTHYRAHLLPDETPSEAMQRALWGDAATVVRRLQCKDGSVLALRTELLPLGGGHVLIHATDLTTLYDTLERVAENESVLARAQEIGQTGSWVLRMPERTVRWFGPIGAMLGVPTGATFPVSTLMDDLVHPDDRPLPRQIVERAIADGSATGVVRTLHPDGTVHWLRKHCRVEQDERTGEVVRIEGVLHDITEYREQDERYRELLEAVRVPMFIWSRTTPDAATKMLYANEALSELVDTPVWKLLARAPGSWLSDEERAVVTQYLARISAGEQVAPLQIHIHREDGVTLTCLLVAGTVHYQGRAAMCAQIVDISEEIRLREVALRARETDLALTVAAGVAHDFNNILTGMLGYLDFAAEELGPESPGGRYVEAARRAGWRAASLARALLGYSRSAAAGEALDHGETHVAANLTDVVREAFGTMRAAIDRRVSMVSHESPEPVHASIPVDSLLRVLVNLLANARDATLERAASAGPGYRPSIELGVEARSDEGVAVISVRDNGAGIPDAIAERVFETYFTTKGERGGSGVGLGAARELARTAGGELSFTSEVGVGTTFSLVLPLMAAPEAIEF